MRNVPSIVPNPLPKPVSLSPKLSSSKKPITTDSNHSTDLLGLGNYFNFKTFIPSNSIIYTFF